MSRAGFDKIRRRFPHLQPVSADSGHNARQAETALARAAALSAAAFRSYFSCVGDNQDADAPPLTFAPLEGPVGEISDIVSTIMYLEAAPFVTGEILHVGGGQSAGY